MSAAEDVFDICDLKHMILEINTKTIIAEQKAAHKHTFQGCHYILHEVEKAVHEHEELTTEDIIFLIIRLDQKLEIAIRKLHFMRRLDRA